MEDNDNNLKEAIEKCLSYSLEEAYNRINNGEDVNLYFEELIRGGPTCNYCKLTEIIKNYPDEELYKVFYTLNKNLKIYLGDAIIYIESDNGYRGDYKITPLMVASFYGRVKSVKYLLEVAEVNVAAEDSNDSRTALDYALGDPYHNIPFVLLNRTQTPMNDLNNNNLLVAQMLMDHGLDKMYGSFLLPRFLDGFKGEFLRNGADKRKLESLVETIRENIHRTIRGGRKRRLHKITKRRNKKPKKKTCKRMR